MAPRAGIEPRSVTLLASALTILRPSTQHHHATYAYLSMRLLTTEVSTHYYTMSAVSWSLGGGSVSELSATSWTQ